MLIYGFKGTHLLVYELRHGQCISGNKSKQRIRESNQSKNVSYLTLCFWPPLKLCPPSFTWQTHKKECGGANRELALTDCCIREQL